MIYSDRIRGRVEDGGGKQTGDAGLESAVKLRAVYPTDDGAWSLGQWTRMLVTRSVSYQTDED